MTKDENTQETDVENEAIEDNVDKTDYIEEKTGFYDEINEVEIEEKDDFCIDINLDDYKDKTDSKKENELAKKDEKINKNKAILMEVFSWVKILVIAAGIAIFINFVILFNGSVPSGSMLPTIDEPSRIIGFRLAYLFSEPERGDIIIFEYPDDTSENYVKRIIGLPGETVEIIDGEVYISDSDGNMIEDPLEESYLYETPTGDFGPYEVPEGCYFVLGDNRNDSSDSRYWDNTYVSEDQILAKVVAEYWPSISLLE